jgi:hypothetical protein
MGHVWDVQPAGGHIRRHLSPNSTSTGSITNRSSVNVVQPGCPERSTATPAATGYHRIPRPAVTSHGNPKFDMARFDVVV